MLQTRPATVTEITNEAEREQSFRGAVQFYTRPVETRGGRRRRNQSKIRYIDGWPHVKHRGGVEPLKGRVMILNNGREVITLGITGASMFEGHVTDDFDAPTPDDREPIPYSGGDSTRARRVRPENRG